MTTSSSPSISREPNVDALVGRGRDVLADVVRANRQLAVAAVDQHSQLDPIGSTELEQRVDGRPDRASGREDVVDEHARLPLRREAKLGAAEHRMRPPRREPGPQADIVAVKGDVDRCPARARRRCAPRRGSAGARRWELRGCGSRRARATRDPRCVSMSSCATRASVRASPSASSSTRAAARPVVEASDMFSFPVSLNRVKGCLRSRA